MLSGGGSGYDVSNVKSNLMKKAKLEYLNRYIDTYHSLYFMHCIFNKSRMIYMLAVMRQKYMQLFVKMHYKLKACLLQGKLPILFLFSQSLFHVFIDGAVSFTVFLGHQSREVFLERVRQRVPNHRSRWEGDESAVTRHSEKSMAELCIKWVVVFWFRYILFLSPFEKGNKVYIILFFIFKYNLFFFLNSRSCN